jgi:phosphoserine phosphatase RsbU/P
MATKTENQSQRRRLADVASRFQAKSDHRSSPPGTGDLGSVFQGLYDLFTKDVTREGLRDLLKRDPKAAYDFFTREVDFASVVKLPWYKRYPQIIARVFIALAYQLTPPRRIAFAVASFAFVLGFLPRVSYQAGVEGTRITVATGSLYWLISLIIVMLLLLMELRDKLGLKADLEIAREIQSGLVAAGSYQRDDFRLFCQMRPANTVGGDYCDLIDLNPGKLAIVIGDVAGKGMPAALLMALLQGSLRTLLTAGHRGADLITKLNTYLCSTIPGNVFITLFYAEIDLGTGDLTYVNAGHNAPFVLRRGAELERLPSTSLILGFLPDTPFLSETVNLGVSDQLLLFTDGLPEGADTSGQEFGEERLGEFLLTHRALDQDQLLQQLVDAVIAHCGDNRPHDDITMISIRRSAPQVDVMNPVLPPPLPITIA